jgi:hypothetical protein
MLPGSSALSFCNVLLGNIDGFSVGEIVFELTRREFKEFNKIPNELYLNRYSFLEISVRKFFKRFPALSRGIDLYGSENSVKVSIP